MKSNAQITGYSAAKHLPKNIGSMLYIDLKPKSR